jgi:purine-binding chemotaxis protein CheW
VATEGMFCTFFLADYFCGIEVERVQEVIRHQSMTRIPLAPARIRGLINLRGQIVTAIDPRTQFGLPPRAPETLPMNVVVRCDDGAVSLLVDEIDEVIDVGRETFAAPPHNIAESMRGLLRGVHKLRDRLLLVLDVDLMLRTAGHAPLTKA